MLDAHGYPVPIRAGRTLDRSEDSSTEWCVYDRTDPDVIECFAAQPECYSSACDWSDDGQCHCEPTLATALAMLHPGHAFYHGAGHMFSHGPSIRHLGKRRILVTYTVARDW